MPDDSTAGRPHPRLRLLGRWQLVAQGRDVELGHREERLTALLGLIGRSSRLHVAGILWPESTDERALASLRRAVLQTQQRSPGLLEVDRLTVGLDPEVEVDVVEVRRAAATEEVIPDDRAREVLGELAGPVLLPGWYDDWVLREREELEQLRVRALDRLARHALEAGDLALTVDAALAASAIDPLLESARELAIRAHLARGDVGSARREFERYRDALRDELDAPPSRAIADLIQPAPAAPAPAPTPAPATKSPAPTKAVLPAPPPREPASAAATGGAVLRLLALAALVLAGALTVVGVGHRHPGGEAGDQVGPTMSAMRVVPATVVRAGRIAVRPVGPAVGRVAFLVRSSLRPALVRLEVRGHAGAGVVRRLVVRHADGRVLEVAGLDPGVYRWLATTSAYTEAGRVRVSAPPAPPVTAGPAPAATASPVPASEPTGSAPAPSVTPTPTATPQPQTTESSSPTQPSSSTHVVRPQPQDPGLQPPAPVG